VPRRPGTIGPCRGGGVPSGSFARAPDATRGRAFCYVWSAVPRTVLFLLSFASLAAVPPDDWLAAARKGDANRVEAILKSGAELEAKDQDGRTALMLAAQYGRADTVSLLLAKGARADARDRRGWIAYMLALLSPSGGVVHTVHDKVLKLLPQPHLRLAVETMWAPGASFFSSCFMRQDDLARHMNGVRPEALVLEGIRDYAFDSGRGLVGGGWSCVQRFARLSLSILVVLFRLPYELPLLEKTFGAGMKTGMRGELA